MPGNVDARAVIAQMSFDRGHMGFQQRESAGRKKSQYNSVNKHLLEHLLCARYYAEHWNTQINKTQFLPSRSSQSNERQGQISQSQYLQDAAIKGGACCHGAHQTAKKGGSSGGVTGGMKNNRLY